ncbi:uncharacterized protein ARMOST_04582 [Armillaria ostoyae]|uniref:Uncharacterized protein n=1 Tax=Armillaria ostoyae TaxID=47428 RepID=A0A284QXR9_ARMOS|nr:uncharacterized protein ARMOST_04582 [Armillaria ostoyae]
MPYPKHRWSNSKRRYQRHAGPSTASKSSRKPKPLPGEYALKFLFDHCPKFPKFEGNVGTRDPAQYDMHLHSELILKDIVLFPDMLDQLAGVVDSKLHHLSGNLPQISRSANLHPTQVLSVLQRGSGLSVGPEGDIRNSYFPLQHLSSLVASTLFAGLDRWSNIFRFNDNPTSTMACTIADGYLSPDKAAVAKAGLSNDLDSDIQLVIKMGLSDFLFWEFKSMNTGSEGVMRAISYLAGSKFPWACCPTFRSCGGRFFRKTDDMFNFQFAITGYETDEDGGIFEDGSDIEFGVSDSGALRFDKSNINSSVDSVLSTSGRKFKIEGDDIGFEDDGGTNDDALSFNDDFTDALKIIQQVWAEAVNVDATFMVLNNGSREFIGIRDRKLQRLYLSPLIDLDDPNSLQAGYFKVHVGLQIAALLGVIQRAKRLNALSRPPVLYTFEYDRGD